MDRLDSIRWCVRWQISAVLVFLWLSSGFRPDLLSFSLIDAASNILYGQWTLGNNGEPTFVYSNPSADLQTVVGSWTTLATPDLFSNWSLSDWPPVQVFFVKDEASCSALIDGGEECLCESPLTNSTNFRCMINVVSKKNWLVGTTLHNWINFSVTQTSSTRI